MTDEIGKVDSGDSGPKGHISPLIEIGILTKGKPTLSMVLASLLLQDTSNVHIQIVDTSDSPVIKRDDVVFALKLAFDRGIQCDYEFSREKERAFSVGRLKLLESLKGPNVCFVDDDVVMPSASLAQIARFVQSNGIYGYVAPFCKNAGFPGSVLEGKVHYAPGGIFFQDAVIRNILLDYYASTVDVLDRAKTKGKVWEIAFLTEVFLALGRKCTVQEDNIIYHLDYNEGPNWDFEEPIIVRNSLAKARELVAKHAGKTTLAALP